MTLRALDLCAGAGGLSLGARRAGFDVLGVEIDADAVESHRANVGPCERSEIECWRPPRGQRFDLVAGGVPCTTFSLAGDREGMRDPRGLLFRHLLRIAVECDARAVWLENVPGLRSWRDDETGESALAIIEAAYREHGYTPISRVLDAADYGVPQHRRRLFVVGFRDPSDARAFRWPEPTHAVPGGLLGLAPWVTVRQALGLGPGRFASGRIDGASGWNGQRLLDVDVTEGASTSRNNPELICALDEPAHTVGASAGRQQAQPDRPGARRIGELAEAIYRLDRPAPTMIATYGEKGQSRSKTRRSQRPLAELEHAVSALDEPAPTISAGGTSRGGAEPIANAETRARLSDALSQAEILDRPATTLQAAAAAGRLSPAGHHERQFPAEVADAPARTIDSTNGLQPPGNHARQKRAVRLTVTQCAALQSFPSAFVFAGTKSSQHRQIGNALPPPMAEAIARSILAVLRMSADVAEVA